MLPNPQNKNPTMKFNISDYLAPISILQFRRQMAQQPYWPRERQYEWTRAKRKMLSVNAYATVPYYRALFDKLGIDPTKTDQDEVWQAIPTLSKDQVRSNGEALVSSTNGKGRVWASTSGSTGERMFILLDRNINAAAFALFWRAWNSGGYWKLGQRQASMKGPKLDDIWRVNWKIRTLEIQSARVTPENTVTIRNAIERYGPRFIRCHPSSLYLLCKFIREQGLSLQIPMVMTGSEILEPFQRKEFESVLGARVFNHYTHWERCASALECEAGRMHAQEDYGHHEILNDEGQPAAPGEIGEVVATGLHREAMPFIRYRTGDLASWCEDTCDCGQSFPVIDKVQGRASDFIRGSNGEALSSLAVECILDEEDDVHCVQYIQERPGHLELRIVPNSKFEKSRGVEHLARKSSGVIGNGFKVSARLCTLDELEKSPIGKMRYFINKIPSKNESPTG